MPVSYLSLPSPPGDLTLSARWADVPVQTRGLGGEAPSRGQTGWLSRISLCPLFILRMNPSLDCHVYGVAQPPYRDDHATIVYTF